MKLHWSFYTFMPFTAAMLFLDGTWLMGQSFETQWIANILVPLYFGAMVFSLPDLRLRRLMWLTVPISGLGEIILSQGVEMWIYRHGLVPFYVPFGHAIVVGTGFQLMWLPAFRGWVEKSVPRFLLFFAACFAVVFFVLHDSFTVALGVLYFAGVAAVHQRAIYVLMPFFVLFVEFVGTAAGTWAWPASQLEFFSTTNPPIGSIMFYVYLDLIVVTLERRWDQARLGALMYATSPQGAPIPSMSSEVYRAPTA
jgi:hypothetical protein